MLNINASEDQVLSRTRARVQRLKQAIAQEKNKDRPDEGRISSLQKEADSRIEHLKTILGDL